MKNYYDFIISVYENDTDTFFKFVEFEYKIAIYQRNSTKRNNLLRVIKTQLLLVYSIKVEGVIHTPSKIVELLNIINSHLNNE